MILQTIQKERIQELKDRFDKALEDNTDELDFCLDLIEDGITEKDIQQAAGEDHAFWFRGFCDSHGLSYKKDRGE